MRRSFVRILAALALITSEASLGGLSHGLGLVPRSQRSGLVKRRRVQAPATATDRIAQVTIGAYVAQVARPSDYVVVKLDIDNSMTELALIEQLLDGNSPASGLVDELFWEHHVAGSLLSCPRLMRYHRNSGWGTMTFNTSDTRETLAGSYDLLTRLREQGIRAHSWV